MSFFDDLSQSLQEAVAIAQGEQAPSREFFYHDVKAIREKTGLSQVQFAKRLHISPKTLQNWEQGIRQPTGSARTLLRWLEQQPELIHL